MRFSNAIQGLSERLTLRACTVQRSRVGALVDGWLSVKAGLSLHEHLEKQLAVYADRRPADVVGAPFTLEIVDGRVVEAPGVLDPRLAVLADPAGFEPAAVGDEDAAQVKATRTLLEGRRNALQHDLAARQEQLANLEARVRETDETEASLRAVLDSALHTGEALPSTTGRRAPASRGRVEPSRLGPLAVAVLGVACAVMLVNEVALVYPTFADQAGTPRGLWQALVPVLSSVGLVVGFFLLAELAVAMGWYALCGRGAGARVGAALLAVGAVGVLGKGAWALALQRAAVFATRNPNARVHVSAEEFFWFTMVIPVALLLLTLEVKQVWAARTAARALQHAWNVAEAQRKEVRERVDERIALVAAQRAALAAETEAARRTVESLAAQAQAMETELGAAVQRDRARMTAWLRSAASALGLDRQMYALVARRAEGARVAVPVVSMPLATRDDSGVRPLRQLGGR